MNRNEIARKILEIQQELPGGTYNMDGIDIDNKNLNFLFDFSNYEGNFVIDISFCGLELAAEGFDENDELFNEELNLEEMIYNDDERLIKLIDIIEKNMEG